MKILIIAITALVCAHGASIMTNTDENRCNGCKAGVAAIEETLKADLSVVIAGAHKACAASKMGKEVVAVCNSVVDGLPDVANSIIANLPADSTCAMGHYCPSVIENPFKNFMRSAATNSVGKDNVNWGPVECNFCKMAFDFLEKNFLSPQFQTAILQGLNKICTDIGGEMGQNCTSILGSYGGMILRYIQSLMTGEHICPLIKACNTTSIHM